MTNELFESFAARAGGNIALAVHGPAGCGKSSFVRSLAGSAFEGASVSEENERTRAEASVDGGVSKFAVILLEEKGDDRSECSCAVLVTSDGSFGASRSECVSAEEEAVRALKESGRPFVVALNSAAPSSPDCEALRGALQEKYGASVYAVNCAQTDDFSPLLEGLLFSFPVTGLDIDLPEWLRVLPAESKIVSEILAKVREVAPAICKMSDCGLLETAFAEGNVYCEGSETDPATGRAHYTFAAKEGMFYSVLSEECGADISDDLKLMAYVRSMKESKGFYDKFKNALVSAEEDGYGVVYPTDADMVLQAPELFRRGTRCGVKLKADAVSYHIVKVDVHSEVSPVSGEAARSEEIAKGIVDSYEKDPEALWNTDMFGKTFKDMVREGLDEKLGNMPDDARVKLRKAVTRIVNEGKGGVICILL